MMRQEIVDLMQCVKALLVAKSEAMALTTAMIESLSPHAPPDPAELPVLALLPGIRNHSAPETDAVCDALCSAAPYLPWRQTYAAEDGFDRDFLNTYGWTDLAANAGPYRADGFRIMLGYWGQGLVYPDHSHPPEEHYLVLAGSAYFRLNDDPFQRVGAGGVFHVPSKTVHSADMRDEPLLAISIWRSGDLSVRINLTDTDRTVAME